MDRLTEVFGALADPTRRAILSRLAAGDATVGELAAPFDVSWPAVSRHLKVLEQAGLIERRIRARWRVCSLKRERLREAQAWIGQVRDFWEQGFDRLDAILQAENLVREDKS
jgi:DNA-binding transcriptional ArsR family regulator